MVGRTSARFAAVVVVAASLAALGAADPDSDYGLGATFPNPVPALCPGITDYCAADLLQLNATLPIAVAYAEFINDNGNCTREAVEPCYVNQHVSQGDCSVQCFNGLGKFNQTCVKYQGQLHALYAELGFNGAVFHFESDVCLPANCSAGDITALQACINNRACKFVEALVPTCEITLDAMIEPWNALVLFVGSVSTISAIFVILCVVCGRSDRAEIVAVGFGLEAQTATGDDAEQSEEVVRGGVLLRFNSTFSAAMDTLRSQIGGSGQSARKSQQLQEPGYDEAADLADAAAEDEEGLLAHASSLVFRNLCYKKNGKLELRGVSGGLHDGTMVCVVGAPDSGAGTLLQVLSGRQKKGGRVFGELLVDGMPPDRMFNRKVA
jgi:hypothetical protein